MTIHLLEDAVGWVAVFIASIVLLFVEVPILDPILAIVINIAVLIFVMKKLIQALKIMLQRVPKDVNLPELREKIHCLDSVQEISHLHIWSLTKEKVVVSVHVQTSAMDTLEEAAQLKQQIRDIFDDLNTEHITIDITVS